MEENINFFRILVGAIIYIFWTFLISYFVSDLAPYATILAAFGAGVYAAQKSKIHSGIINGFLAGLVGGLIGGFISSQVSTIGDIPLSVSISSFFNPLIDSIPTASFLSFTMLSLIGMIFGTLGGFLSSIKKLRGFFLFITMFLLFIFYGATDNMVWNWGKPGWSWNMSFSHVLTNPIDLFVAVVFALVITVLAYILNLFK